MNAEKSDSRRGVNLLRWGGTLLSVVLLILLLSRQGWQEIVSALKQIPLWVFLLATVLIIISRFAVAGRWHALLRATDLNNSWGQTLRITFAGLFATNFLPTTIGGDIIRLAGAVQFGMDGSIVAASLIADRLIGMFGMVLMVPLGLIPLLRWFAAGPTLSGLRYTPILLLAGNSIIDKLWRKLISITRKIVQTIQYWWQHPSSLLNSFGFTVIHMLCFFGIIWVLFIGLDDPVPFGLVAGLYSFVYLVTLLPISINGYGLQELSISLIFSQVGGVSIQHSLTVALIFRTLTMLASVPGAVFVPGIIAGRKASSVPRDEVDR